MAETLARLDAVPPTVATLLVVAVVLAVLLVALGVRRLVQRGRARPRETDPGRASLLGVVWLFLGSAFGLTFAGLTGFAALNPRGPREPFDLAQEIVRFSALLSGVVFLVVLLAAALPAALDLLERRSFIWFVGARHFRSNKSGFLTAISTLSILGVALSSCALCSVTSVMGGFGADLKRKILGNNAHLVIEANEPGGFTHWSPALDAVRLAVAPARGAATPVVAGDAMGSSLSNTAGVLLRGIDPESIGQVVELKNNIEIGKFEYLLEPELLLKLPPDEIIGRSPSGEPYYKGPRLRDVAEPPPSRDPNLAPDSGGSGRGPPKGDAPAVDPSVREALRRPGEDHPGIILGRELAKSLHALVGHEITLLSPIGELGPMGVLPKTRRYRVAAIFYSGMYEYDASHAYVLLPEAQSFLGLEGKITQIDVRVPDPERVEDVRPAIEAALYEARSERDLIVRDWKEMNKNLFSALKLERIATLIILSIAIAVASFCIICTLLLMVTEKGRQIAVLKALGATNGSIRSIFILEGAIIGAIGTVFGVSTAFATSTGLSWFGVRLDPEVYYIDRLPVNVDPLDYLLIAAVSMLICTIATVLPAQAAADLPPLDGLRHE